LERLWCKSSERNFPPLRRNDFVNKSVDFNYIGTVPAFEYFSNITLTDYNDYCEKYNNNWSLKDVTLEYLKADCISLHQILLTFGSRGETGGGAGKNNERYFVKFENVKDLETFLAGSIWSIRYSFISFLNLAFRIPFLWAQVNNSIFTGCPLSLTNSGTWSR